NAGQRQDVMQSGDGEASEAAIELQPEAAHFAVGRVSAVRIHFQQKRTGLRLPCLARYFERSAEQFRAEAGVAILAGDRHILEHSEIFPRRKKQYAEADDLAVTLEQQHAVIGAARHFADPGFWLTLAGGDGLGVQSVKLIELGPVATLQLVELEWASHTNAHCQYMGSGFQVSPGSRA